MVDVTSSATRFPEEGKPALPPSLRLLVDTHSAMLMETNLITDESDVIASALLADEEAVALSPSALNDVFNRIDQARSGFSSHREAANAAGAALNEVLGLPEPLRDAALTALEQASWKFAGPGIKTLRLDLGDHSYTELLRIEPGAAAPQHDHAGYEYTLVVSGAFRDNTGRFGPGDLSVRGPGDVHSPISEPGAICFALAVAEGPVALTGALGFFQRLLMRQ